MTEHHPELNGNTWKQLETTVSYKTQAQLTPTLTHVITHNPVTSGAKGRAMSQVQSDLCHVPRAPQF